MSQRQITPRYKMMIQYDINASNSDAYYQFVLRELNPAMQALGLHMTSVWHTAYGNFPVRQLDFVADSMDTIHKALDSPTWADIERKFNHLTINYSHKIVRYRDDFQF